MTNLKDVVLYNLITSLKGGIRMQNTISEYLANNLKVKEEKYFRKNIIINAIGFLLGRASILGGIAPFGIAYYGALSSAKVNLRGTFLFIIGGILSLGLNISHLKYIISMVLYYMLSSVFANSNTVIKNAFKVFISIFIVGTCINLFDEFLLYDFILNLFEAFAGGILTLIFANSINYFIIERKERISTEQIISTTVIISLMITGISNFTIWGLEIRNVLIITTIIMFSLRNGPGVGAAIGIVAGMVISMSSHISPILIGVYGLCGLMAGVFRDLGKVGSILGFLLANSIITIYLNGSTEVMINIIDILGAGIVVILTPKKFIKKMNNYLIRPKLSGIEKRDKTEKIRDITIDRLNEIAQSFEMVAHTLDKIEENNKNFNRNDVSTIFDEVAERVCRGCSLNTVCWHKDFYNTYQAVFEILDVLKQKGKIEKEDLPQFFKSKCKKFEEFIKNTNFIFELYSLNLSWKRKIEESKLIVSQQIEGISQVVNKLARDIDVDIHFIPELENDIYIELQNNDVDINEVMVVEDRYGKLEVTISHDSCNNKRICNTDILPLVCKSLNKRMVKEKPACQESKKECVIKFKEEEAYKIICGVASLGKEDISGDNYKIININGGAIVALSDGMGSGKTAFEESSSALELLETFLKNGFDKDLSVKLVNSILILKSNEELFTTIDLSIIDLFTAEVEFAKIGAAATFIKKKEKVEVIKSTSLPAGILKNIDIELTKRRLDDEDMIIMVSDGVLECRTDLIKKEDWIVEELSKIEKYNPQEIANHLLNRATNYINEQVDDMTVIVIKLLEKL